MDGFGDPTGDEEQLLVCHSGRDELFAQVGRFLSRILATCTHASLHPPGISPANATALAVQGGRVPRSARRKAPSLRGIRYTEDGEDKVEEAREKAAESSHKEHEDGPHMPFLATEQPKYEFHLREADTADPARVRVAFVPKHSDKHLVVGSAWVDTRTGEVLTMGVAPSKPGLFVDYLHVTLEFGEKMGDGPGVSKITFEGSGGLLLFHRKFRGAARLSGYREL
ncbi:MAG TPA: hypothetical protein VHU80_12660 [Polyangiaceae bacterium]|jgi:hypothetical protein|nr:hypothetical protein [Polyangiaceae bacterium]